MSRSVRVLLANSDEDLVFELRPADTEASLAEKVRKTQGWAADLPLKFVHGGRDLFEDDKLDRVNPATFILWIAAGIITPLGIQNMLSGEADHSTRTSMVLAFVMSGIYACVFYPCFRWPQWAQIYSARWKQPWDLEAESLEQATYDFGEEQLYDDTLNLTGSWSRLYKMRVPERPCAPMICAPTSSRKDL